ncbi:uncharacterized protein TA16085 [Theileria annulata]|uniref:Uncharacterized protein n=1 Tax=Theileria annulata TaxID=5874 RepID=Q4UDH4_THEAN|nr:uncharacterized protein TA16085 [Theileria annulata]CAI74865.1 hypothetical protein, conserved [Theileria annulata]|eukprot:XP_952597.1 hypothetical protein, conserved [Theileria annulata]
MNKMFRCKACSGTPFAAFFGLDEPDEDKQKTSDEVVESETDDGALSPRNPDELSNDEQEKLNEPRNAEEVTYLAKIYNTYVHERAKILWKNESTRIQILKEIAMGCCKNDDPVLGNDIQCVKWVGDFHDEYPVIHIQEPKETMKKRTYVSRMLVFLFADEESYQKIDVNKYTPFTMVCGNKWCVNLTHIMLN